MMDILIICVIQVIILALFILFLLYKYAGLKKKAYLKVFVYASWLSSFGVLLILPVDVYLVSNFSD